MIMEVGVIYGGERDACRPLGQQVKWELCPDATHYLPKTDQALGSFWRLVGSVAVTCWRCDGTHPQSLGISLTPTKRARLIARYPEQPNWSKGPADASHWGAGCEQWMEAFYKFDGVDTYYAPFPHIRREGWVQLDVPLPADRIAQLIARPVAVQPVALPARSPLDLSSANSHDWDQGYNDGWDALAKEMAKLGPLYTGPDAGEIARLSEVIEQQKSLIKSLRADLQESISIGAADAPQWDGQGQPPAGATCLVTPHNSQWGFAEVGDYECKVLAYNDDYVWLNTDTNRHVSTRIDKVDFAPIRTASSEARVEAAQAWLKGIEQEYGQDVADKCEDILMQAESGKAGSPEPRPALTGDTVERDKAVSAMWTVLNLRLPERYRTFNGEALRSALGILHDKGFRKTPGYDELLAFLEWVQSSEKQEGFSVAVMVRVAKALHAVRGEA